MKKLVHCFFMVLIMFAAENQGCGKSLDPASAKEKAREILDSSGVKGGLVVHIGCDAGFLTSALRVDEKYLVHGLDTDAGDIKKAREYISSNGLYGKVSVARWDGKDLPYVDNIVNLLVVSSAIQIPQSEINRVLAPDGVAIVNGEKIVKPIPADTDEWTHFLHDSGGNSVAEDEQIHSPTALQWVAAPKYSRSHEMPSSVQGVVTSGGRIFTIFDEAPAGVFEKLPWKCKLIARDAFNGKLLWKVPLKQWDGKSGAGRGGRWEIHHTLPRRLIARDDRVYITLQFLNSPVSVLDAATGKVLIDALPGTKGADEMVLTDDVLVVKTSEKRSLGASKRVHYANLKNSLVGIDVDTGKLLWRRRDAHVGPYTLAAKEGCVVYHDMNELICLSLNDGKAIWKISDKIENNRGGNFTLVVRDGTVLLHANNLKVFSLKDGEKLWEHKGFSCLSGACTQPTEIFVVGETVWFGRDTAGYDLKTGEVKKKINLYNTISSGHHRRCLRGKATVNYVIRNKRGAEFIDLSGEGNHMRNDWLRTPCFTGGTPANGMFYKPPDQCFCYPGVKVTGYMALRSEPIKKIKPSADDALVKGTAYNKISNAGADLSTADLAEGENRNPDDWPVYRGDNLRSGRTGCAIPCDLKKKWEIELDSVGSQPVIVKDRLWTAEEDKHAIHCIDVETGGNIWSYIAGGPVDSSPTIYNGMVLFGCRDGYVYCLRASDGELVWRFRAAPGVERLVSFEHIESVWPVQGSVLVRDGTVYFAAGRSSFLNGGIVVYGLEAKTGKVLYTHVLEGPYPDIKTQKGRPFAMEGALPDLLVSDKEKNLYMMRIKYDSQLKRQKVERGSSLGELAMGTDHLMATGGFLDDSNFDRIYWMHGNEWPGFHFAQHASKSGQLVVFDDSHTYAVKFFYRRHRWSPKFFPEEQGYLLFADDINSQPGFLKKGNKNPSVKWLIEDAYKDRYRRGGRTTEKGTGYVSKKPPKWKKFIPVRVRAMVMCDDRLVVAGPQDKLVEGDPLAAFEGRTGAEMRVFSTGDGALLKTIQLESSPVFDGISSARGRLYMAAEDGKLICFAENPDQQ